MKRKLSLLLAVVMILGSFSFAFADDDFDVPAFLEKEGILVGNDSGDLMLDQPLLRKDAVVLLARLLKAEEEAEAFEKEGLPTFNDLADNPYYKGFLAWAEDNGYFTGKTDGSFGYTDNLEAVEYALVLLRALGYVNDNKADEWDNAWTEAEKLGLLEDVKAERRDEIKREEVAQMTFNALGVTMKDSDKTLAEFLGITMPDLKPTELTAKVLDTENLAEVVVELSNVDLVKNKEALTNPANYRLSNDVKVQHVDLDGDNVILTLVPYGKVKDQGNFDSLVKGKKFNLTIRNIDKDINKTYKGILANDNAIPVVEDVEFIGTHGIKITTSEPIANPLERNFRLDSRTSMIVEQYGRDIILTPYHGKAFDEETVELTIDKLEDFAGYTAVKDVYDMEISDDDALPVVEEAYRSGSKLVVVFDRDVYHDSISAYSNRRSLGNVSFADRRVEFYADDAQKIDTNVVEYTFEREIPKGVEIDIEGVANHFDKAMEKQSIVPVEYNDEYAPVIIDSTARVEVTEAYEDAERGSVVDAGNMTITFDKDIAEFVVGKDEKKEDIIKELNDDIADYFTLYELDITRKGKDAAEKVEITVEDIDKDEIELSFEDIRLNNKDRDYDYVLEVRNFSDLSRNRMDRDYLDFQVVLPSADFAVELKAINNTRYFNRDGVEIVLEFNDYVDKEEASIAKNYYLNGKLAVSEAIVERDGYTVSLVVYDKDVDDILEYGVLEISPRVTNADGDSLSQTNRFVELMNNDEIAAKKVTVLIAALFDNEGSLKPITAENLEEVEEKVEEIEEAYGKLSAAQKALLVDYETDLGEIKDKIQEVKDNIADENAAKKVEEATNAVVLAEAHRTQEYVDAAKELVDALPEGEDKEDLQARLTAVQEEIDAPEDPVEEATIEIEFNETLSGTGNFLVKSVSVPGEEPAKYAIKYFAGDGVTEKTTDITEIGTETGGFYKPGNEITIYIYDADETLIHTFENYVINM